MSMPNPIVLLDARARYVHPAFEMTRASTKTVFDSAGRLVTVPVNALGWDHDPATGQARGYLAEPPATNLLVHSNDLTQSAWTKGSSSITANAITGPDGTGMAKLVENDAEAEHYLLQSNSGAIQPGVPITGSVIVRAAERENIVLRLASVATSSNRVQLRFHAAAGQIVATATNGDAVLLGAGSEDLGNGFHRVWISGTLGDAADDPRFVVFLRESSDGWGNVYKGDGTSGLYVGYCQLEEGTYPTSYIETGGATATRAIERLTLPSITSQPWWRNDEWSMVIEYHNRGFELGADTLSNRILSFDDFAFMITYASTGRLRARGSILASPNNEFIPSESAQVLRRNRIAFAISDDGFQAAANGALTSTDTVTGQLGDAQLTLGTSPNGDHFAAATGNYRVTYYPARISNADLQSLTAMQE